MIFQYDAINKKGKDISGIVDAVNQIKAKEKLKSEGLYVKKIWEHTKDSPLSKESNVFAKYASIISDKISAKKIQKLTPLFSRQLSTLLRAGMPLNRAMADIIDQTDNSHMKLVLADIRQKLEGGSPLSKAIASHNEVFSEMYSNMIRIGENMGSLDTVLERLADIEEKNANIKNSLKLAFQYPVFMLIFTLSVLSFLMIKVVPTISDMFSQLNKELPLPTKIVVGTSSFAAKYWIIILIALIALFFLFRKYSKTPEGRRKIDAFMFKIPVFNHFYTKVICLRFCQNLGIMAQNGVDIVKSLDIIKKQIGNTVIEKKIEEASERIVEGAPISKALIMADFLPKMVTGMISVAEASDTLDSMLIKISDLYQNEIDRSLLSLTKMIEPVLIVVMGGLIGLIVLSIMLPIIDLNLSIQ